MSDWRALAEQAMRDEASGTIETKGTIPPAPTTFVPIVPIVPAAPRRPAVVLREWHSKLEPLAEQPAPEGIEPGRWHELVADSWWAYERFCSQAVRDGWSALDLFGVLPWKPSLGGLVARLGGARNLKISGQKAVWSHYGISDWTCIGGGDGLVPSGIVLLWDLNR